MRQHSRGFAKTNRPKKNLLIGGVEAVTQALRNGEQIERIFTQNNMHIGGLDQLKNIASDFLVPINKVPPEKMKGFNFDNHGGVIALRSKIQYQQLQDVISFVVENGDTPLLVLLDGITDIRNIGAIARTAYCCGVHAIVLPEKGVGAMNDDAINTSAGALEKIAVCRVKTLHQGIDEIKLNGIKVFASEMTAKKTSREINFSDPCAIIMGSEDKGIHPSLYALCDEQFAIKMVNDFESLNVSVATGMILYEAMTQRLQK